jgi:hypothetical protein
MRCLVGSCKGSGIQSHDTLNQRFELVMAVKGGPKFHSIISYVQFLIIKLLLLPPSHFSQGHNKDSGSIGASVRKPTTSSHLNSKHQLSYFIVILVALLSTLLPSWMYAIPSCMIRMTHMERMNHKQALVLELCNRHSWRMRFVSFLRPARPPLLERLLE